jgi:ribosomal-protein-alanine N-acetyltransferase
MTSATPADIASLLALENRCFSWPWGRPSFDGEFTAIGAHSLAARRTAASGEDELVGYLFYRFIADEVHIFRMAVSPEWRRQGIGSRLLAECIEKALGCGVACAMLEVRPSNSEAVGLYCKFGFHRIATRCGYYADSGEDAYILKLDLKEGHV